MDKYEYKVRADEIKSLIAEGEYAEAVKIADTIDWRRVRSVMMLCTVSDLYKINRRYQESKDILLLAYEKHPTGRAIVYSLCELAIKMEEYIQAVEYYKEFVQIAPRDTGKYVLLYRLYEAQDVSLEERIAVLEEFKKRDYREKWAYELAYLYHRIGLTTKCVEECDEMYLWFGEGKYVLKALELKSLHVPLNAEQQEKYTKWLRMRDAAMAGEDEEEEDEAAGEDEDWQREASDESEDARTDFSQTQDADVMSMPTTELPEVKTVDVGQYNTLNLQMALAESLKEIMTEEEEDKTLLSAEPETNMQQMDEAGMQAQMPSEDAGLQKAAAAWTEPHQADAHQSDESRQETRQPNEELHQAENEAYQALAAEPAQVLEKEKEPSIAEKLIAPLLEETAKMPNPAQDAREILEQIKKELITSKMPTEEIRTNSARLKYEDVLSQEYDGQIRLVVPDEKVVEKQITGQLSIEDIMAEWEEMKKSNEQKRMEDVRKRILNRTGSLFADFDEATKSGLLEELEKAFMAAIMQDPKKEAAIKEAIHSSTSGGEDTKLTTSVKQYEASDDVITKEDEVEELVEIEEPGFAEDDAALAEAAGAAHEETERKASGAQKADSPVLRELTEEEEELFDKYIQHKKTREQLINILDNMSMAAYTGNVIITGEEDGRTIPLAKNLIREMQYNDNNFSGKVAKISAGALNKKSVADTLKRLSNGALIIENAADLNKETVAALSKALENENTGLLLILEDDKKRMDSLLEDNVKLNECFNLRIDIEPLDDESLVAYARQYAEDNEYSIDEFGVLALHTRIADMQTSDHEVSVAEVRDLVDDAIYYANKKTPKHFVDVLLAKRYDDEDMIILREKDFMHY